MNNIESQFANLMNDEEPYVGMPLRGMRDYDYYNSPKPGYKMPEGRKPEYTRPKCVESVCSAVDVCPLAMAYVPWQSWGEVYKPTDGFRRGTIFPELDLPFLGGDC